MNSVPPIIHPPRFTVSRALTLAGIVAVAGLAAVIFFFNPATHHFYPVCQFHRLTGLNCPGCGMTRSFYALLHGHWTEALRDNALLVIGLAVAVLRGGWFGWNRLRGRRNGDFISARWLWLLLIVLILFTVLRNLPVLAFLSPV